MADDNQEWGADIESPPNQTEDHVHEAVPISQIASTFADLPSDFGEPGLADFADPAWDDTDEPETPDPGEPEDGEEEEPHDPEEGTQ
jgi:hypothetical protein